MREKRRVSGDSRVRQFSVVATIICALEGLGWVDSVASAPQPAGAGAIVVGAALAQGVSDRLSVGDIRPQPHGEWGGRVGLDYQFSERWAVTLAGQVGGSWLDFNGFAVSGKIVDANWSGRVGVDRLILAGGGATLFIGIGLEYGEARSWLDNLTISQEGPHNYAVGGSARVGISEPPRGAGPGLRRAAPIVLPRARERWDFGKQVQLARSIANRCGRGEVRAGARTSAPLTRGWIGTGMNRGPAHRRSPNLLRWPRAVAP